MATMESLKRLCKDVVDLFACVGARFTFAPSLRAGRARRYVEILSRTR
jgi:hypothetical protein